MFFSGRRRWRGAVFDHGNETVTTPGQSLDVAGLVGRIGQDIPQFLDGSVQSSIEIDKGVFRPERLAKLLARNQFAWLLQQECKHLIGLPLKLQSDAVLVHLARTQIHIKSAKACPVGPDTGFHRRPGLSSIAESTTDCLVCTRAKCAFCASP